MGHLFIWQDFLTNTLKELGFAIDDSSQRFDYRLHLHGACIDIDYRLDLNVTSALRSFIRHMIKLPQRRILCTSLQ